MPPDTSEPTSRERPLLPTMRRFLPYLWPADAPALRLRIVGAMTLVVASKLVQVYGAPFALQGAVDGMGTNDRSLTTLIVLLVIGYAAARFGSVVFDNLRNAVFERVGQDATRRLAALPPRTPHRRRYQGGRARHQEHRHDALFPAVQHRADRA
jgi:ATP-binding cassette subfamily B protein